MNKSGTQILQEIKASQHRQNMELFHMLNGHLETMANGFRERDANLLAVQQEQDRWDRNVAQEQHVWQRGVDHENTVYDERRGHANDDRLAMDDEMWNRTVQRHPQAVQMATQQQHALDMQRAQTQGQINAMNPPSAFEQAEQYLKGRFGMRVGEYMSEVRNFTIPMETVGGEKKLFAFINVKGGTRAVEVQRHEQSGLYFVVETGQEFDFVNYIQPNENNIEEFKRMARELFTREEWGHPRGSVEDSRSTLRFDANERYDVRDIGDGQHAIVPASSSNRSGRRENLMTFDNKADATAHLGGLVRDSFSEAPQSPPLAWMDELVGEGTSMQIERLVRDGSVPDKFTVMSRNGKWFVTEEKFVSTGGSFEKSAVQVEGDFRLGSFKTREQAERVIPLINRYIKELETHNYYQRWAGQFIDKFEVERK